MDIVVDFDGTCVTHDFPRVGKDIGSVPVLKKLVDSGHNLILFTMRGNRDKKKNTGHPDIKDVTGQFLDDAVKWFKDSGIKLYGIQVNPTQKDWTNSPKAYGALIIDDAALGCPLKTDETLSNRPFVDWTIVEDMLINKGLI